jgi:hypothetical protein
MEEILIENVRQRTFLYDSKSPDYRDQHMRANAWEGIGKELKLKRKSYVNSRDVRIVCPRLKIASHVRDVGMNASWGEAPEDAGDSDTQNVMCCDVRRLGGE